MNVTRVRQMVSEKQEQAMYCHSLVQAEIGHDPSDIGVNQRKPERKLDQHF